MGRITMALGIGVLVALAAILAGSLSGRPLQTLSVVGSSVVLECQPAAALVAALRYPRFLGAMVVVLANLAPIPVMVVGLDFMVSHWPWASRQVERANKRAGWVARYGPLMFIPLCPVFGAYACIAIGKGLGFRPAWTLGATVVGMLWSTVAIVYGGHWVVNLILGTSLNWGRF